MSTLGNALLLRLDAVSTGAQLRCGVRLVSRFRSSPEFAARSEANFGIEGH
jgi:hypothetical protein